MINDPREAFADAGDFDSNPSWRIFRIMSEFVEGFSFVGNLNKSVTFFGSARLPQGSPYYELARATAQRLSQEGYDIVTGGGPGIMQAGNQGAYEANGNSIGINIQLPMEQGQNQYVRQGKGFHFFFSRKVMLAFSAEAFLFYPGGFGTLDELFELTTLLQTGKLSHHTPIILMGSEFWQPGLEWIRNTLLGRFETISPKDLDLWTLTDDIEQVVKIINESVARQNEQLAAEKGRTERTATDRVKQATKTMKWGE
jgi:uncharacterized protein (TIGR00730 family)